MKGLTEQDIIAELERREGAARHLSAYAENVVGVTPALHQRYICDTLEAGILNDEWDDCVICIPPGGAKSTYGSHCLPAWFLGHFPEKNIILASHTATLAEKWSRRVRDTLATTEHSAVFEDSQLSKDSTAVSRWSTSKNGEFLAAGVGMSILGFRADCLVGDTLLRTESGYNRIDTITVGTPILSYDTEELSSRYCRVVAKRQRTADITYRIHTTDGHMVEATGNHPFFTPRGFIPAMAVVVGDVLLSSVWQAPHGQRTGDDEEVGQAGSHSPLLQQDLLDNLHEHPHSGVQDTPDLHQLWSDLHQQGTRFARSTGLLGSLSQGEEEGGRTLSQNDSATDMRRLRSDLQTCQQRDEVAVLLNDMQEQSTQQGDVTVGQSGMATRKRPQSVSGRERPTVQSSAEDSLISGQYGMCDLRQHGEPSCSPCGHGLDQQHSGESGDTVRPLSLPVTRCGSGETTETTVARVEVVRGNQTVWDIEVEDTHTFFANGVLTHNCAILDDPISGWEQAQNITQLEKIHDWYKSDLKSRLKPGAKIVIICQRTAAFDMAGFVIKQYAENPTRRLKLIVMPMICTDTEADPLHRPVGARLWPEWFSEEMVLDLQKDDFIWQTMYQQKPPSDDGSWVTTEDIQFRPRPTITPSSILYGMTDLALSVNTGDYTVHMVVAIDENADWDIVHATRERVDPEVSSERLVDLAEMYRCQEWLIDDDNASKVFMPLVATKARLRRVNVPWKPMPMRGVDKETRATPLRGQWKRRKIYMPADAPFAKWLVKEALIFPNAVGAGVDDGIDALGLLGRRMSALAKPATPVVQTRRPTIQEMTLNDLFEDMPTRSSTRI